MGLWGVPPAAFAPTPPVELNEYNIRKLHDLYPVEEHPMPPPQTSDALQMDEETLSKVCLPEASQQGPAVAPMSTWYPRSKATTARWHWEYPSST